MCRMESDKSHQYCNNFEYSSGLCNYYSSYFFNALIYYITHFHYNFITFSLILQYQIMINLVDQSGKFNQSLHQFPTSIANIAIFGSQSSGKSTLMNASFDTNFPILNTLQDRKRCTKGIWFQNNGKFNIVDTEGFDSAERKDNERIFQRQIALFCLALADVVVVNIWMNQIGRYQGGHMQILRAVINAANYLLHSQTKTLLFVVKDCSRDADPDILRIQLQNQIQKITKQISQKSPKSLKLNFQYFFMSHYIYQPAEYEKQAKKLPSLIKVRKSALNQHEPKDRIVYLSHLWDTILANEGEIDLRIEEEALRTYVVARVRAEVVQMVKELVQHEDRIGKKNSYQGFYRWFVKKGFEEIKARMPKYLQQKTIKTQFFLLQQQLEYIIHMHFTQHILPAEQQALLQINLTKELQKSNNSIQLQKHILEIRKKVLETYKIIVKGHKQSNILIKRFSQKIAEQSVQFQRQVSHLFNMFETKLEIQINKELDRQVNKLKFQGDKVTEKIKMLCKQFQYNQWEINTKQIYQKVSHRVLIQKLSQKISQFSNSHSHSLFMDNEGKIISSFKEIQKKVQVFITNLLTYFQQQDTGEQYIQKSNEKLRQCLQIALNEERKQFRISMLMLGIFLIFLYGEFMWLLKTLKVKKRMRNNFANFYLLITGLMLVGSIAKKVLTGMGRSARPS